MESVRNDVSVAATEWSVSVFYRFGIYGSLVVSVMNDVSVAARNKSVWLEGQTMFAHLSCL